jgi:hypothetical protein
MIDKDSGPGFFWRLSLYWFAKQSREMVGNADRSWDDNMLPDIAP